MESIIAYFGSYGIDFKSLAMVAVILLFGSLLIGGVFRFIFGRKTMLGRAVSSTIAIVFIYLATALILCFIPGLQRFTAPLPFATFTDHSIELFQFQGEIYTTVSSQLLSMIILAFLVNLVDRWMPKKTNFLMWLLFRCITVILGLGLHFVVTWLFNQFLPMGIVIYAPVVLLVILLVMLLTGALRFVVGAILTTVNPVIAGLYTFFFATIVGKQVTTAVVTTCMLVGIIYFLQSMGIVALPMVAAAFVAYIPFLLLLVVVWYIVNRFL